MKNLLLALLLALSAASCDLDKPEEPDSIVVETPARPERQGRIVIIDLARPDAPLLDVRGRHEDLARLEIR